MHIPKKLFGLIMTAVLSMMIGCDKNENARLAQMADEHLQRQAEQNRQMTELHREVAEGSRQLVEADAKARQEMVAAQRQLQTEHAKVGQQRDALENERREIALQRHREPIIAAAVLNVGLLLACLLPLMLCWRLLHGKVEPADDQVVAEALIEDLVRHEPLLLPRLRGHRALARHDDDDGEAQTPLDDSVARRPLYCSQPENS